MLNGLICEYAEARRGILQTGDVSPQYTAKRLADDALVTAVALKLLCPDSATRDAQEWVAGIGWLLVPQTGEMYTPEWEQQFDGQGRLLTLYPERRGELIPLLARGACPPTLISAGVGPSLRW